MMRNLFLGLCGLMLLFGCQDSASRAEAEAKSAFEIISETSYTFPQPLLIRENLRSERGTQSIDTFNLKSLQFPVISKFDPNASYYLMGKVQHYAGEFTCMLIFSDAPEESNAWLVTYNNLGILVDYRLAYTQKGDADPEITGYVRGDALEITKSDKSKETFPFYASGLMGIR